MTLAIDALEPIERSSLFEAFDAGTRVMGVKHPFDMASVQKFYDHCLRDGLTGNPAIALGLCFGAVIVSRTGYEWVRGTDMGGSETGLAPRGKTIFIAPISMLQKKLRAREACDLEALCGDVIGMVDAAIAEGTVADR